MTATETHARRGRVSSTLHNLTRTTPVRAGVLLAVVVVCSGSWWDPREWVGEAVDGLMMSWAAGYAEMGESMLLGAFDGSLGTLGNAEWSIATVFTGRLGAVMGVFAVAFCAVEVVAGMAGKDPTRIVKGAAIALLAWPLTATAAWATIKLTNVSDSLSTAILSDVPADVIAARFFAPLQATLATGPAGSTIMVLIFAVVVLLPTLLLSLVMAFRSFGLLIAVAFAPVALMTQGWAKMRGMARGWATIVGALVVTKPLAAGVIVISLELMESLADVGAIVMGAVGLWMAAFAPVAAAGLFNFAGGEIAAAQGAASAQAGRHMAGVGRGAAGGAKKLGGAAVGLVPGGKAAIFASAKSKFGGAGAASASGGGTPGPSPTSGPAPDKAGNQASPNASSETKPASAGASAPASAAKAAPGTSRTGAPSGAPASSAPPPVSTAQGAPGQAPSPAQAGGRPPAAAARPAAAAQGPAAGGAAPVGTGGAQVPLGAGGPGPGASSSGGAQVPLGAAAGGSAPLSALAGPSVTTTEAATGSGSSSVPGAGGGVSTTGAAAGTAAVPVAGGSRPTSTPAPSGDGGVSTTGGRHAATAAPAQGAVTGMGGLTSGVVDATMDAVSSPVDVTNSEDSK